MPKQVTNALSALAVKNAGPGLHADGRGLYLEVKEGGSKAWTYRYSIGSKRRLLRIGSADDITLKEARERVGELRRMVSAGVDPLEQRRTEQEAAEAGAVPAPTVPTFRQVAGQHIEQHRASWKSAKHAQQWQNTLTTYCGLILDRPVNEITRDDVLKVLSPIWSTKPETASRVRQRIESVLDAAAARELRGADNPARWRGGLASLLPKASKVKTVEHHPALPWKEAPALYAELRQHFSLSALALEWLLLTATRAGETAGALWAEIDLDAMVWTIDGSRMKAGKPHRVPIVGRMADILRQLPRRGPGVFPGLGGRTLMHPESLRRCLQRDLGRDDLSVHGFRSSFRDWAGDTGHPHELAELALAHAAGDAVVMAYRRGDALELRRPMMESWARYLAGEG